MLRVWIAGQGLHCALKVGIYEKNGPVAEDVAWGIILADAAKHIADALAAQGLRDRERALEVIARSFARELEGPTSEAKGGLVE